MTDESVTTEPEPVTLTDVRGGTSMWPSAAAMFWWAEFCTVDLKSRFDLTDERFDQLRANAELEPLDEDTIEGLARLFPWSGLPRPCARLGDRTVIASVWIKDDEPPTYALVMFLNPEPPYYTVAEMIGPDEECDHWLLRDETCQDFENINHATAAFADNGGDV